VQNPPLRFQAGGIGSDVRIGTKGGRKEEEGRKGQEELFGYLVTSSRLPFQSRLCIEGSLEEVK